MEKKCQYCGSEKNLIAHFNNMRDSCSLNSPEDYRKARANPNNYDYECNLCSKMNGYGTRNIGRALRDGRINEVEFKKLAEQHIRKQESTFKKYDNMVDEHHKDKSNIYIKLMKLEHKKGIIPTISRFFNKINLSGLRYKEQFDGNLV